MKQSGEIHGKVEYRLGDGPMQCVPPGAVQIEVGNNDVTLSWGNADTHQSAAIPATDFARYVKARAIVLSPAPN